METLQRLHNRGSISTGYDIDNSLKFESDNAEYLMAEGRSQGTQETWTFSVWLKRSEVNNGFVAQYIMSAGSDGKLSLYFRDDASYPGDQIFIYMDEGNSQKWVGRVNESFRDTSAWYHLVFACDTTDSTPADRTKLYINGEQRTITYNATMNQNTSTRVGDGGGKFALGARIATAGYNFNGYMAEAVLVDGSALTPTSFGEYDNDSGIWKPKDVSSLSLGTTGFHMNFDDSSNVGKVQRGNNGGNFDKYNLTAADQATDTPTNNFATINTIQGNTSKLTITNGATSIVKSGNHGWQTTAANIAVREGKWYAEFKLETSATPTMLGVNQIEEEVAWYGSHIGAYSNSTARGFGFYSNNGYFYRNGGSGAFTSTWGAGDIISIALRINSNATGYVGIAINGTWQNSMDPSSGITNMPALEYGNAIADGIHYTFAISTHEGTGGVLANFGGFDGFTVSSGNSDANGYGNFEYAVPTGYYALCTKNLEEFG